MILVNACVSCGGVWSSVSAYAELIPEGMENLFLHQIIVDGLARVPVTDEGEEKQSNAKFRYDKKQYDQEVSRAGAKKVSLAKHKEPTVMAVYIYRCELVIGCLHPKAGVWLKEQLCSAIPKTAKATLKNSRGKMVKRSLAVAFRMLVEHDMQRAFAGDMGHSEPWSDPELLARIDEYVKALETGPGECPSSNDSDCSSGCTKVNMRAIKPEVYVPELPQVKQDVENWLVKHQAPASHTDLHTDGMAAADLLPEFPAHHQCHTCDLLLLENAELKKQLEGLQKQNTGHLKRSQSPIPRPRRSKRQRIVAA